MADSRAEGLVGEGEKEEEAARYLEALSKYDEALQHDPKFRRAHLKKCRLLRDIMRFSQAVDCAEFFAAALPSDAAAHHELGLCLAMVKRYDDAVASFRKAVTLEADMKSAWKNMGVALGRLGKNEEAFLCYERAAGRAAGATTVPTPAVRDMSHLSEPPGTAPAESASGTGRDPPTTGGNEPPAVASAPRELERAFHDVMAGLIDRGGGCVQVHVEGAFSFKASVAILKILLQDYDMDGVVVSLAKPSSFYEKVLGRRVLTPHPPHYVEIASGTGGIAALGPDGDWDVTKPVGSTRPTGDGPAGVTVLSAFEPGRMDEAIRTGLQRVAEKFGGEEHFVVFDDLTAMEFFNGSEAVRKFVTEFFRELSSLHILCFVLLPEQRAASFLGHLPLFCRDKIKVRPGWLAGL
jgi:hypothetical protein